MKVQRGNVARVAVLVGRKSVDSVWVAVRKWLGRLEGSVMDDGCIVWYVLCEVSWTMRLGGMFVSKAGLASRDE